VFEQPGVVRPDPPRKTGPQEVGNFGLRGSASAGLSGMFVVNVTQVIVSSNWPEELSQFSLIPAAVRGESGKREAFSKAGVSPSFPQSPRPLSALLHPAAWLDLCGIKIIDEKYDNG
jgi:hypothetical protein